MKGSRVATRYAKALLDLAVEQKALDKVYNDMTQLANLCEESKDLKNLLHSPIVDERKKASIFEAIFEGKLDKMSLGFIKLIIKNKRENVLPEIADSFLRLYKEHNNIVEVSLTSAAPLEKGVKDKLLQKISSHFKGEIELKEKIDPALVGGFIIRANDQQLDASIASQLKNLKNILLN